MIVFDPLYFVLAGPALLLAVYAQLKVKSSFARWSRRPVGSGLTGARTARLILDRFGLSDVPVERSGGWLSDHYDPRKRALRLSPDVYDSPSVAAVGVAAHEAGHAIQHATDYAPLKLRNAIVPTAQLGSWLAFPMLFIGMIFSIKGLALVGLLLFTGLVVFQAITLPVEFNASNRAKKLIMDTGVISSAEEARGVASVLNAAALTYVAATLAALMQLLYFALRLGLLRGDD